MTHLFDVVSLLSCDSILNAGDLVASARSVKVSSEKVSVDAHTVAFSFSRRSSI